MNVGFLVEPFVFRGDPFALGWVFARYSRLAEQLRERGHNAFVIARQGIDQAPYFATPGENPPNLEGIVLMDASLSAEHCAAYADWTAAWKDLMDGETETIYDPVYRRILEEQRPDHLISWTNNHAVSRACAALGIATHFQELGLSRRPFPPMCFWDEEGINGGSGFARRWRDWTPALPDRDLVRSVIETIFRGVLPEDGICRKRMERFLPRQSEAHALITLQVEDDSNLVAWGYPGGQFSFLSEALLRNRNWPGRLLVKQHPLAKVSYRAYCQSLGVTYLSEEVPSAWLARACDAVLTQNSSTAFEAALFGKPALTACRGVLTGTPLAETTMQLPAPGNSDSIVDSGDRHECLASLIFQYLVPEELLFDAAYVERRLSEGRQAAWEAQCRWLEHRSEETKELPPGPHRTIGEQDPSAMVQVLTAAAAPLYAANPSQDASAVEAAIANVLLNATHPRAILPDVIAAYNASVTGRSPLGSLVINPDRSATIATSDLDYFVLLPHEPFDAAIVNEVWLLIKSSANTVFSVYWLNSRCHGHSERCAAHQSTAGAPDWKLIRFPVSSHPEWEGPISHLRVDLFNSQRPYDAVAQLKWIALV